ncbi:hypothetical protein JXJ21_11945 [candidate division KSB1 bacterium]|nr:hypothetical protein [candidate division KSB1 bacterium]
MKKLMAVLIGLLGFSLIVSCGGDQIQTQWADRTITINGKSDDWEGIAPHILEDQNMSMCLANDENSIYLMFQGNDEQLARRIQMMGVTIWLDKSGEKKKDYGICYTGSADMHFGKRPGMPDMPASDGRSENMNERMERMREKRRLNLPAPGKIFILRGDEKNERPESALDGPAAGSAFNNGGFCYEFRMPIPITLEPNQKIKLGLELGGMSKDDRDAMRQGMKGMRDGGGDMGMPPGDMGGGPGGMGRGPGGMRGGGRPPRGQESEKQDLWFTVILADNSNSAK